jgi:hypothetical protein
LNLQRGPALQIIFDTDRDIADKSLNRPREDDISP